MYRATSTTTAATCVRHQAVRSYSTSASSSTVPARRNQRARRSSKPSVFESTTRSVPRLAKNTPAPATRTDWTSSLCARAAVPVRLAPAPSKTYDTTLPPKTPQLPTLRDGVKALRLSLLPGGKRVSTSLGLYNAPRERSNLEAIKRDRTRSINEQVGGDYEAFTLQGLGLSPKTKDAATRDAGMAVSLNESLGKDGKKWLVHKVEKLAKV
ncbi:uncharacterized protein PFL1_02121 [Pseudozyma flocculosa PF-1]|uniref:uncharacterized protein n=1 Tax=Pseudozyma flocculosa PF-1 TaxID=1277687 RepID=UPI000456041E|nr:uncharacterized protein PFL1_02121 [Pseudozyma flocculosa PF-1]EPQ30597.1 hypothetical protein PFL1_02121 [Pseudozyma flocculosa PF-1]